jgi:carboxyl-terminal processing protease
MNNKYRKFFFVGFVICTAFLGMILGAVVSHSAPALAKDRYADLQMFTKVLNLVEQHYVEEVDTKKLIYGGIKGMLASLDPHTNFLPPEIFKEFKTETTGEFGGIGIEISVQDDILTVMSPIEDTPAYKAGIKGGDKIVEIEGKSTKGITLAEAVNKMRGKAGTPVSITIWREGFEAPKKFVVDRDNIKVKSVKYTDMTDGYAYVRVTSFIERTGDDLEAVLSKHEKKYGKIKGLILDLRNNPGGLLDQAIQVCNEFINEGIIVSTIPRNKKEKDVVYAKKEGARMGFPMIVLMNEYSASASEIVGGALQDHKRAIIMGTRSFGKGSVQSVVELGDGAGLKLTVARYYTPSGRSIQAHGIEPDIHLDTIDTDAYEKSVIHKKVLREADIEGHLINETDTETKTITPVAGSSDSFWKKDKKDAEKEAKLKEEEDAKLPPNERLIKKDYQVAQALNYVKAWSVFKDFGVVGGPTAQAETVTQDVKPVPATKPKELPKKKKSAVKATKPATKVSPSPSPAGK